MKRVRPSGLTILEALVSLLLVGIVMSVLAAAIGGYSEATQRAEEQENQIGAASGALALMAAEIEAASALLLHPQGLGVALEFVDPNDAARLPATPTPWPSAWEPLAPQHRLVVAYSWEADRVVRTARTTAGSVLGSMVVARGITGLSVSRRGDGGLVDVRLSFLARGGVETLRKTVLPRAETRRGLPSR